MRLKLDAIIENPVGKLVIVVMEEEKKLVRVQFLLDKGKAISPKSSFAKLVVRQIEDIFLIQTVNFQHLF